MLLLTATSTELLIRNTVPDSNSHTKNHTTVYKVRNYAVYNDLGIGSNPAAATKT